jgi:SET and MYND domain-containing protein 4
MDTKKNNSLAKKYRNAGNDHFRKQEYFEALMLYNRSLCVAEKGSESIPIAFANRSAVYIKLNQFDLCLENIQLARKFNYPAEKMEKLNSRENECKEMMKTKTPNPDDDPFNYFKLSYPANQKYPQIVDCLELRNNKKFGNYVVTTRDLKTGDIIAIEEPTYKSPNSSARLHRCGYCFKDQLMNLFPCSGCAMGKKLGIESKVKSFYNSR